MTPFKVVWVLCSTAWLVTGEYSHFQPSYGPPHYDSHHLSEPIHHHIDHSASYEEHAPHHELIDHHVPIEHHGDHHVEHHYDHHADHHDHHDHHHHEEHHEAKPYSFGYAVKDHHHGTDFDQHESSDGHNVKGQYRVKLPDGRTQIVTYHADWKNGFHADVHYEGEAHYPEPSHKESYGHGGSSHGGSNHGYSSHGGDYSGYSYPDHSSSYSSEGY